MLVYSLPMKSSKPFLGLVFSFLSPLLRDWQQTSGEALFLPKSGAEALALLTYPAEWRGRNLATRSAKLPFSK